MVIRKFLQKIFKKFTYYFYSKIYGKIEKSIKSNSDSRIEIKTVNFEQDLKYNVYKITKGRLYTDCVQDAAVIIDNQIVDGPSFQLRKNNNSRISENIVFQKGTPRILKKLNGSVLSLLTGGGGNNNYWHWLYDVLPRLKLCEKIKELGSIDYFLLPNLERRFQKETLKELNIELNKLLSSQKYRHIKAKELIVTDHPYMATNDAHIDAQKIPKWIINWLKYKFLQKSSRNKKKYPKNIYLDRTDSKSNVAHLRSINNEDEVKKFLENKNFTLLRLNDLNFLEQVHYFNNADCVIGLHGAAFANLSFCKNGAKVIEFRMTNTGKVIENLARSNNLKFDSIICQPLASTNLKQFGHINIPLNLLEQKMYDIEKNKSS